MLSGLDGAGGGSPEDVMRELMRAFVVSRMCGAQRMPVRNLDGVSVSFDGESAGTPRRLYVALPTGGETCVDLVGETDEECAGDAMRFLGLG
jgi:hypothetical protein